MIYTYVKISVFQFWKIRLIYKALFPTIRVMFSTIKTKVANIRPMFPTLKVVFPTIIAMFLTISFMFSPYKGKALLYHCRFVLRVVQ